MRSSPQLFTSTSQESAKWVRAQHEMKSFTGGHHCAHVNAA
jgi:hypothetical protein